MAFRGFSFRVGPWEFSCLATQLKFSFLTHLGLVAAVAAMAFLAAASGAAADSAAVMGLTGGGLTGQTLLHAAASSMAEQTIRRATLFTLAAQLFTPMALEPLTLTAAAFTPTAPFTPTEALLPRTPRFKLTVFSPPPPTCTPSFTPTPPFTLAAEAFAAPPQSIRMFL
jgi:hypothetical protein